MNVIRGILLSNLFSLLVWPCKSQGESDIAFEKVEISASTNAVAFKKHIEANTILSDSSVWHIPPGEYKVVVSFVVDKHSYLGQFRIKSEPGFGLGQRGIKVVKSYKGKWQPASQCGRLVNAYRDQELVFTVSHGKLSNAQTQH